MGTLTSGGGRTLTWDAAQRPTSITSGGVTESYAYDADGARARRTVGGVTTAYFGDDYEVDAPGGAWRVTSTVGGQVVAQRTSAGVVTSLHGDHLGSVSAATSSSGAVLSTQSYKPWGEIRTGDIPQTDRDFTGQRRDGTGLLHYNARYYDPGLGLFLSPDTIVPGLANSQALHRYSYVGNNPVNRTDPTGHCFVVLGVAVPCPGLPVFELDATPDVVGGVSPSFDLTADVLGGADGLQDWGPDVLGGAEPLDGGLGDDTGLGAVLATLSVDVDDLPDGLVAASDRTLKPGPFADKYLIARDSGIDFLADERMGIDAIGSSTGCHTCGTTDPGTMTGHFIPDHQPPSAIWDDTGDQRLYPHCQACARIQGGEVRVAKSRGEHHPGYGADYDDR